MARIKYYYDTETCQYQKSKVKTRDVVFNALGFLAFTFLLALGLAFAYNAFYMSPEELELKKENQALKKHYKVLEGKVNEVNQIITALQHRDDEIYRKIYEIEPLPGPVRDAGIGGSERYASILKDGFKDKIVNQLYNDINKLKAKANIQNQSYNELLKEARNNLSTNVPSIQPVKNDELDKLSSGFGKRIHPIHKGRYMHHGVDFAAPRGTPVFATADGVVAIAKESKELTGYGNRIELDHQNGYSTKYAHLETITVTKGETVKRGQIIGTVGNSGGSIAPHLHYEVIKNGEKLNPIFFVLLGLDEDQYNKLLILSSRENQSLD